MKPAVRNLNTLIIDFQQHWEKENTSEMFMQISGTNDTTELEANVVKSSERLTTIETFINDPVNFEELIESWDLIDLKALDGLIEFFGINVEAFESKVKTTDVKKEIKDWFLKI